jgi:hypothetical protein
VYTVAEASLAEWDDLVARFPDRTVFHRSAWLEAIACTLSFKLILTKVLRGQECVAIWPCFETRKGPFRVLGSPLPGSSTPYLGPLFAPDADMTSALEQFMASWKLGPLSYFACRTQDEHREVNLRPFGFNPIRRFETYLIDIGQAEETLWANLSSECRNRIRKARKSGLEVHVEENLDFLGDFWRTSQEVFARSGIRPNYTPTLFQQIWHRMRPAGQIVVLSGFLQGARVGSLILPHDGKTMHYLAGGCQDQALGIGANNLLQWEALLLAKRLDLERYDFVSSLGGPGRFKKTFGPIAVDYCTHWERSGSQLAAVLKNSYERFARSRRRLQSVTGRNHGDAGRGSRREPSELEER